MQSAVNLRLTDNRWIVYPVAAVLAGILAVFFPWLLGAVAAVALFAYFWKHKEHFLIFLVIYTPFEELILKMIPDNLYAYVRYTCEIMIMAMMFMIIIEKSVLSRKWKPSPIDIPVVLFIFIWFISTFINSVPITLSISSIKNIIRYIPLLYIAHNIKPNAELALRIFRVIFIIAIVESFICIGQAFSGDFLVELFRPKEVVVGGTLIRGADIQLGSYHTRFTGSFPRANDLGNYLSLALCLMTAVYTTVLKKRYLLLAFVPILVALVLTSSRMSWISAYIGIGIILFLTRNRFRMVYMVIPIVLILIFLAGIVAVNPDSGADDFNIIDRSAFIFTSDYYDAASSMGRLYTIFEVLPAVISNHPILGLGPGAFMRVSEQMAEEQVYARASALGLEPEPLVYVHDIGYAAIFVQAGLMGVIAMIWIFWRIYKTAKKTYKNTNDATIKNLLLGSLVLLIMVAIQNSTSFNITYRSQSLLIWIVCGLIMLLSNIKRSLHENPPGQ